MFRNYFKSAFRIIIREKTFSFINIAGMAIGLASAILIFIWVSNELSYDKFYKNKNEIYRLIKKFESGDKEIFSSIHPVPLASQIKEQIPEIKYVTRYSPGYGACFISYQNHDFKGLEIVNVDPDFFRMFDFGVIEGDPENLLENLYSIIITKSLSNKLFGSETALGKVVTIENKDYTVSGVIKDLPKNTHFKIDAIRHFDTRGENIKKYIPDDDWTKSAYFTYIQINKNNSIENIDLKIADIVNSNQSKRTYTYISQPITDIHLFNAFDDLLVGHGDWKNIYILISLAILILIVACINYINLATAKFDKKSKAVAIRKLVGASKKSLIAQFIVETSIKLTISLIIAFIIIELSRSFISLTIGANLQINYIEPNFISGVFSIFFITILLSSIYPSVFLSSFNVIQTLKGIKIHFVRLKHSVSLRKSFVVFQFFVSISLITIIMAMFSQYHFIKEKDLGYDENNIFFFSKSASIVNDFENVRNLIKSNTDITGVSLCNPPLYCSFRSRVSWEGLPGDQEVEMDALSVDSCFINTLKAKIIEGDDFNNKNTDQKMAVIINETAKKLMKDKTPLGKTFSYKTPSGETKKCIIIGVVKDFHLGSMRDIIPPLFLINDISWQHQIAVRFKPNSNITNILKSITTIWESYNSPDIPFEPFFLKDENEMQYSNDYSFYNIIKLFTLIPILLSLIGIYGLTQFTIESSFKNIGIRKVHGANSFEILKLLLTSAFRWIGIALIFSVPLSYIIIGKWLSTFAYHINFPWWAVFVACLSVLILTLSIIGFMVVKASRMKPVECLRYE